MTNPLQRGSAESALKDREAWFRQAMAVARIGTWRHDFTTNIVYLDDRAREIWGFDRSEVDADEMRARIHRGDDERVQEQFAAASRPGGDGSFSTECRIFLPNREVRWLSLRARLYFEGEGPQRRVAHSIGTYFDITERKRSEAALRESEERFRQIAENSGQVFWLTDWKERKLLYVSPSYETVYDRSCESIWKDRRSWLEAVYPEDRERINRIFAEKGEKGEPTAEEYRILRKDGSIRWIHDRSIPLRDAKGEVIRWVSVAEDISDRKQAEEALRAGEARFRAYTDHATDAFFFLEPGGRVLDVNRQACEGLGYTREELIGMVPADFDSDVTPAMMESIEAKLAAGELVSFDSRHRRKDGSVFPVEVRIRPIKLDGRPFHLSLARDLTERKMLEDQVHHAHKMEAIGQLAGGVAHDFNNYLTVISANTHLLLNSLGPGHPSMELVVEIRKAVERSTSLTRQLLALGRRQVLTPKVLDLNEVVRETEMMLSRMIGEAGVLITDLEPGVDRIKADRGQVEQVLLNLAVNARDAMPRGGILSIETRNVDLPMSWTKTHPDVRPGAYVLLKVTDSGIGMTGEIRRRLFEPFFTTKGLGQGTGLGLAVVHGIVKQSEGHIEVDSTPGQGTSFRIYLPKAKETAEAAKAPPAAPSAHQGDETILLVEDDEAVRGMIVRVLRGAGYTLLESGSSEEAERICATHGASIHLILTDVVMPGLSGPELAERLIEAHPNMKMLFMSGYTDDAMIRHGVSREAVHFIQKPFSPEELARGVRRALTSGASGLYRELPFDHLTECGIRYTL